jgi:NADPH:quinone reductase-like Zn-dependent oxidoreductase
MRVAGVIEFGGPEALEVVEIDDPVPGPGEVRVRVHAATVNPTDTYHRNGSYRRILEQKEPPYIPGMEAAGVVDMIGDGVTALTPGDEVMAIVLPTGPRGGAYAERIVVPERSVARVPRGATVVEAATLPMNGLTARLALDMLALQPGQTLAVTGAAGSFGGYAVELAKADGLRVIADASEKDEELVRSLGADVVVRRGDDVATRIREHAPHGVDGLVDGSVQGALVLPAIKDGGGLAAVRPWQGDTERDITVHQVWVSRYATEQEKLDGLRQLVEDGKLTLRVARTFPAEHASEAHRLLEAGGTRGRLVITF